MTGDPLVPGQGHRGDPATALGQETQPGAQQAHIHKLVLSNAAESINDLRVPPGNRLEKLTGGRAGQYSIRVNDQWRICFTWSASGATNVEFVDYH
jgi:proteic killer suppression protein